MTGRRRLLLYSVVLCWILDKGCDATGLCDCLVIPEQARTVCGAVADTAETCVANGCCWDPEPEFGEESCYEKAPSCISDAFDLKVQNYGPFPESSFTASSYQPNFEPFNFPIQRGGWLAASTDDDPWILVDLGREYDVQTVLANSPKVDGEVYFASTVTVSLGTVLDEWTYSEARQRD